MAYVESQRDVIYSIYLLYLASILGEWLIQRWEFQDISFHCDIKKTLGTFHR